MSFFSEASLAMIPSGYKTSKVYSAIPTSGDGDLTFSRSNDTATRVGPDGLIEKVRTNQVQQSETFDNVYWTKTNLSVTANAIANPLDGALTAELLTVTDPSGPVEKTILNGNQSYTAGTPYTISAYFKAGTISTDFRILAFDDVTLYQSGIIDLATIGNSTAPYEDVGGGWYRFRFTFTPANSTATGLVYLVNYAFGIAANAGTNVYVYGAQIETGDIATDYIATTSAAVSVGPVANLPRLDYLDSSSPRLLLEPQRTNLVTYSEQLDNAVWNKSQSGTGVAPVVTANNAISPDGTQNADTVVFNSGAGTTASDISAIYQVFGGTTATYTASFYAKTPSGTAQIQVRIDGSAYEKFTITNEWQRFTLTRALTGTSNALDFVIRRGLNEPMNASATIQLWGAQVELGAYATSYIPTLGAAVTRGADAASKTSASALIGQTEGTLFLEFDFVSGVNANYGIIYQSGFATYIYINQQTAGSISGQIQGVGGINFSVAKPNGRYKCALAYKSGDSAFFVNGVQVGTTNTTTFTPAAMDLFSFSVGTETNTNNQALLFPTRLSNSQLAELTA
jgi:hypothetical protein